MENRKLLSIPLSEEDFKILAVASRFKSISKSSFAKSMFMPEAKLVYLQIKKNIKKENRGGEEDYNNQTSVGQIII